MFRWPHNENRHMHQPRHYTWLVASIFGYNRVLLVIVGWQSPMVGVILVGADSKNNENILKTMKRMVSKLWDYSYVNHTGSFLSPSITTHNIAFHAGIDPIDPLWEYTGLESVTHSGVIWQTLYGCLVAEPRRISWMTPQFRVDVHRRSTDAMREHLPIIYLAVLPTLLAHFFENQWHLITSVISQLNQT